MHPRAKVELNSVVAHVIDSLSDFGAVECRRFFGGWSLRLNGRQFACVIREELYFAAEGCVREDLIAAGSTPFTYESRGRTIVVKKYQNAPACCLDDPEELRIWVARVTNKTEPALGTSRRSLVM